MVETAHDGFSQFFAETRDSLLRYVRRLTRSHEAAEDIVQEAYARTLVQSHHAQTARGFLFVTARNLVWKAHRHQQIAATDSVGDVDALGVMHDGGSSPEDAVIADEASVLLRQAIERLPPQCRAALSLRVFHACSHNEIAEQLGISTNTVEKHIWRGLRDVHAFVRRRYDFQEEKLGSGS